MNQNSKKLLLVLIFTFFVHIQYLNSGFIWLDHNDIEQGFTILPLNELFRSLTTPFGQTSFYRPLVVALNSLNMAVLGTPFGFHLINLALHLFVVFLFYKFMKIYSKLDNNHILIGAIILGIHPLSILIIGSITHRQESLLLIFTLLSLNFYKQYVDGGMLKDKLFLLLTFILSLLTKETAIVVLPISFVFLGLVDRKFKKFIKLYLTILLIAVLYLITRSYVVPSIWASYGESLSIDKYIATRIGLFFKMVIELINPTKPSFSDSTEILSLTNYKVFLALLTVIVATRSALKRGMNSEFVISFCLTLVFLAPGLNIIPVPRISSPHYAYLALPFFIWFILTGIGSVGKKFQKYFNCALYLWIFVATLVSFNSGKYFRDDLTFFSNELKYDSNFLEAHYYLGNYYLNKGDFKNAEYEYKQALENKEDKLVYIDKGSAIMNLAAVRFNLGKFEESDKLYDSIYKDSPYELQKLILYNKALIAQQDNNHQKVIDLLSDIHWNRADGYLLLAESFHELSMYDKEIEAITKSLKYLDEETKKDLLNYIDTIK